MVATLQPSEQKVALTLTLEELELKINIARVSMCVAEAEEMGNSLATLEDVDSLVIKLGKVRVFVDHR